MYTFQAFQILIFLIPGFVSEAILNVLIVRKEQKEFAKIIEALIFSLPIYTVYSFISGVNPLIIDKKSGFLSSYDGKSFLWLTLISFVFPLIISWSVTNDRHMKIARFFRISRKTARSSVWFDVFSDVRGYVIINFDNGRRIYGWPKYYSNNPENPYIFLFEPAWVEEDKYIDLNIEGILITPEQKIESIEFLKLNEIGAENERE